jgi:hypothetical protein
MVKTEKAEKVLLEMANGFDNIGPTTTKKF